MSKLELAVRTIVTLVVFYSMSWLISTTVGFPDELLAQIVSGFAMGAFGQWLTNRTADAILS